MSLFMVVLMASIILYVQTLFRVWDVLFVEGMVILFRVAVAILMLNEKELVSTVDDRKGTDASYSSTHHIMLIHLPRLLAVAARVRYTGIILRSCA